MLEPHVIEYHRHLLDRQSYKAPTITQEQLECFSTRYLLSQKPYDMTLYSCWPFSANSIPKKYQKIITPGLYNMRREDFVAVLNKRPHVPNKRESRELRKQKIKQGV